jgi:hypothetical protein
MIPAQLHLPFYEPEEAEPDIARGGDVASHKVHKYQGVLTCPILPEVQGFQHG